MATYHAPIPSEATATRVFDAVGEEVVGAMTGICVTAHGDERMGRHFSIMEDEVFKVCIDPVEIFRKISDGASVGTLFVRGDGWNVRLCRHYPRPAVDDCTVPAREHYSVAVTLIRHPCFGNAAARRQEYARWLEWLEEPEGQNHITESWSQTKDVLMGYRIQASQVPAFLRYLGLSDRGGIEAHGEVRELEKITRFAVHLSRYGFRGLYSLYPEWPTQGVTH